MNLDEIAEIIDALDKAIEAVPGLIDDRYVEILHGVRMLFDVMTQMDIGN